MLGGKLFSICFLVRQVVAFDFLAYPYRFAAPLTHVSLAQTPIACCRAAGCDCGARTRLRRRFSFNS
jgi:hypothetical protein